MSEGRCCKGSDIGGQQSPWQQGDLHGNRATAQSGPSYQYNTDKLVWNEYLLKKWEGGMYTKQGIEREPMTMPLQTYLALPASDCWDCLIDLALTFPKLLLKSVKILFQRSGLTPRFPRVIWKQSIYCQKKRRNASLTVENFVACFRWRKSALEMTAADLVMVFL